jgi:hypothetical protein
MKSLIHCILATLLAGLPLVGCNRSTPPTAVQPNPAAVETEESTSQSAPSEPKVANTDRRAAEWVLNVDGSIRAVIDGVTHEIKKGENLPDGAVKLLAIDLRNCPKATDDGRDYLRGLSGLRELVINDTANIRNLDFLADMTGLEVLNSEGISPLVKDKDLAQINGMAKLKTLIVVSQVHTNSELTDKVFAVIKELRQLEQLRLCNCSITDDGVRLLDRHPALRFVDFWQTTVGDAGIASLVSLPKLEQVAVQATHVTDAGVKAFQAKAPKCRVIK